MKVNFIIAGTQKGGSTALAKFLAQHPQIAFGIEKECHFFDHDTYFEKEKVNYSIYHKNWIHILLNQKKLSTYKIYGESTPIYMYWQECMERIKLYNYKMKLIFILRNPIDRAYSQWNMNKDRLEEDLSFIEALKQEKTRRLISSNNDRLYSYINRGFYSQQIEKIMNIFPHQQMLFLKNEDLKNNHQQTLNSVFEFLEVDSCNKIEPRKINSRFYPLMNHSDREFLKKQFSQEIIDLENLLDWHLSDWKK